MHSSPALTALQPLKPQNIPKCFEIFKLGHEGQKRRRFQNKLSKLKQTYGKKHMKTHDLYQIEAGWEQSLTYII